MPKNGTGGIVAMLVALVIILSICGAMFAFGKSDPFSTQPSVKAVDVAYATRAAVESEAEAARLAADLDHAKALQDIDAAGAIAVRVLGVVLGVAAIVALASYGGVGVYRFAMHTRTHIGVIRQNERGQLPLLRDPKTGAYFRPQLMTSASAQPSDATAQLSPEMQLEVLRIATQPDIAVAFASQETTKLTELQERQMLKAGMLPNGAQVKPSAQLPPDAVTGEFTVVDEEDEKPIYVADNGKVSEVKK